MEDKKKPIYKKWWFWLIVVVVMIGLVGSSSNTQPKTTLTSGDENSTSQTQNNNVTNTNKEYGIGEVYQDNSIAIKFVSLDDNFEDYSQYADIKDNCKIIKAEFEFENIGKSDVLASSYNFNCYADGYDCESFWSVDDSSFSSTLSTGKKAKGCVYFQVPENSESVTLEYTTNVWTSSKIIFKVK